MAVFSINFASLKLYRHFMCASMLVGVTTTHPEKTGRPVAPRHLHASSPLSFMHASYNDTMLQVAGFAG